jgi:hypothetical protein
MPNGSGIDTQWLSPTRTSQACFDDAEEVWLTLKYLADIVRGCCKCHRKSDGACRLTGRRTRGKNCISGKLAGLNFQTNRYFVLMLDVMEVITLDAMLN